MSYVYSSLSTHTTKLCMCESECFFPCTFCKIALRNFFFFWIDNLELWMENAFSTVDKWAICVGTWKLFFPYLLFLFIPLLSSHRDDYLILWKKTTKSIWNHFFFDSNIKFEWSTTLLWLAFIDVDVWGQYQQFNINHYWHILLGWLLSSIYIKRTGNYSMNMAKWKKIKCCFEQPSSMTILNTKMYIFFFAHYKMAIIITWTNKCFHKMMLKKGKSQVSFHFLKICNGFFFSKKITNHKMMKNMEIIIFEINHTNSIRHYDIYILWW